MRISSTEAELVELAELLCVLVAFVHLLVSSVYILNSISWFRKGSWVSLESPV